VVRVKEPGLAEDLVQETFLKALGGFAHYRGEASLFTWLCQICRHEISDWSRRTGAKLRPLVSIDDVPELQAALESMTSGLAADETGDLLGAQEMVHLTLDYLPENYGAALEWKYVEGLSVEEIAARMGATSISVQSLLARARAAFRRSYGDLIAEIGGIS
jgi:RNA polymerase sigma-70 factor (ECF subfamily)